MSLTKNLLRGACAGVAACLMAACGGSDKFTISGEIVGAPSMNLYMKYYGNVSTVSSVTVANAGKFEFVGHSPKPTIVEIMDNESNTLGCLYMANGDKAKIMIDRGNPFLMRLQSGSQANADFAAFANENAKALVGNDRGRANGLIEAFISENPQSIAGAMLMATAYDTRLNPTRADSIMRLVAERTGAGSILDGYLSTVSAFAIPAELSVIDTLRYRPRWKDTTLYFTPAGKQPTLIAFTTERESRRDSIVPALRRLDKEGKARVLDFMLCRDTISWRSAVRWDSATWQQAWAPGGVYARDVDRLAIPALPYYIVADTAGRQIYRGASISAAVDAASGM
ncbi:MAG: DUF4369 domain-containing protein [Clostridium sp.]|nr:DUF4369 domain-containing protein [Clostridium sp.]